MPIVPATSVRVDSSSMTVAPESSEASSPLFSFDPSSIDVAAMRDAAMSAPLTPEGVIAMMQSRVRDLDRQIHLQMGSMQARTQLAQDIGDRISLLRGFLNEAQSRDLFDDNGAFKEDVTVDGISMAGWFAQHDWTLTPGPDGSPSVVGLSRETLQRAIDDASGELQMVNSGNETAMIELQSPVQQRTSVIQLSTNILKTIDEANDSIVGNLR